MRRAPAALRRFLAVYDPAIARLHLAVREAVLAAAPDATELVYDAYNAVTVAYSFTDRLKAPPKPRSIVKATYPKKRRP